MTTASAIVSCQLSVVSFQTESQSSRFIVCNVDLHSQQRGRKGFPLRVSHQRQRATPAQTFMQKEIERAEIRQLEPFDCAVTDTGKMVFHSVGGNCAHKYRVELVS